MLQITALPGALFITFENFRYFCAIHSSNRHLLSKGGRAINDFDDTQLLQLFVTQGSEVAFGQLVERHLHFVYSVCLRELDDPALAEDVTQAVFLILLRKAASLQHQTILVGWLFHTARFAAKNALRQERRRRTREHEVVEAMQQELQQQERPEPEDTWQALEPLLHDALATLSRHEREAVLLRYFGEKSLKEVGHMQGIPENTARMRVSRAIEKLRRYFKNHGVAVPIPLLTILLAERAVQAAPGISATLITEEIFHLGVVAGGSASAAGLLTSQGHIIQAQIISQGVLKSMLIQKVKVIAIAVGFSLMTVGVSRSVSLSLGHQNQRPGVLAEVVTIAKSYSLQLAGVGPNGITLEAVTDSKGNFATTRTDNNIRYTLTGRIRKVEDGNISLAFNLKTAGRRGNRSSTMAITCPLDGQPHPVQPQPEPELWTLTVTETPPSSR